MKSVLMALAISFSSGAQEAGYAGNADMQNLRKAGRLVTVEVVLGQPVRFFVVGREEAKVDLSELKLTVQRLKPYPGKTLTLNRENGYFVTESPDALKDATAFELKAESKTSTDKIRFDVEKRKP